MSTTISVLGFPIDLGAGKRGVDMGPSALRIAGIIEQIQELGYDVQDLGNVEIIREGVPVINNQKLKYLPEIIASSTRLCNGVQNILKEGNFPLILGGDHSMSIGSLAGISAHCKENNKKLGVIWVDAHADMNTAESTPSGNIHGMPLSVSMGIGVDELTSIGGDFTKVDPENVVIIGVRSVDQGERELIRELGVKVFSMHEIDELGIAAVMSDIKEYLLPKVDHLHVSFDVDSTDPSVAPGVGTPVPGGLTYREAHFIMESLVATRKIGSLEIAEVNPVLDTVNSSAQFAVGIATSGLGQRIL
jgi:arginase